MRFQGFIPAFYGSFLGSSPEVREKFAHTDFDRQHVRLAKSLRTLAGVVQGDLAALRHLNGMAESHDCHHIDIRPHLYVIWRKCLLETAAQFDDEWSVEVHAAWESILDSAIHYMSKRHAG